MKRILMLTAIIAAQSLFAGVQWTAKSSQQNDNKSSSMTITGYAQGGSVREEFSDVKGELGFKDGNYYLYNGKNNTVAMIDVKEKSYIELPLDNIGGMMTMGGAMQMTVSNPQVTVKVLAPETVNGWQCKHILITTTYDMEMKILFMTSKSHVEQTQELWGTQAAASKEMFAGFKNKAFRTGMKELDSVITKNMQANADLGFVVKSITKQKNTADGKTTMSTSEMTVQTIDNKNLSDSLFTVPTGYEKTTMEAPASSRETQSKPAKETGDSKAKSEKETDADAGKSKPSDKDVAEKAAKELLKGFFR
ncbi:MAG: DUF4412 domain-containing protein [Spirochaetes bacterium]|nr:DUF4412 domain-containing protein [Spirochaetota bacterium]